MYRSKTGGWLTTSLFWESWKARGVDQRAQDVKPVFSLYDEVPGLINCRSTFIELSDPTGYKWATTYLGSWEHWEKLLETTWFVEALESWRRELAQKMTATAIEKIKTICESSENDAQVIAAAKYIAEQGWKKTGRGRPTHKKDPVSTAIREIENDDALRIGLKVIDGGRA